MTVTCKTLLLASLLISAGIHAETFPNRPVKIIVPVGPGTGADIVARQLGKQLSVIWGQGVVIENIPGAGGELALQTAGRATPDGYVLLQSTVNQSIGRTLYPKSSVDLMRDFRHIVKTSYAPLVIATSPGFSPNNLGDLVQLARAKPGSIDYGSAGNGSVTQLSIELLKTNARIQLNHVPYKSTPQMMTDLMANQIPIASPALATALPAIKAGKLKGLAVTSQKRSRSAPDIPSVAELGYSTFDVSTWNGLSTPTGTPETVVAKIYNDVAKVVKSQEFTEAMLIQSIEPELIGPSDYKTFIAGDIEKWALLIRQSGAKID